MIRCLMGVRFSQYVPNWPPGSGYHTSEVYSCGLQDPADLDDAIARVEPLKDGRHLLIELHAFCGVCATSGIQPGRKRKACGACAGRGVTPITSYSLRGNA